MLRAQRAGAAKWPRGGDLGSYLGLGRSHWLVLPLSARLAPPARKEEQLSSRGEGLTRYRSTSSSVQEA